jgi:hypothetical protein
LSAAIRVLVAVADYSLGGTSRSAVTFALAWQDAGAAVSVLAIGGLHESRRASLAEAGILVEDDLESLRSEVWDLLHMHHGADSSATRQWTDAVLDSAGRDVVVLTHNVFGQALRASAPPRTVVGLLGHWVALQYRLQAPMRRERLRIVPNPQDFDFFRAPTPLEREQARRTLGIRDGAHVVLRLGSPIEEKWSATGYRNLVAQREGAVIRLIGVPPSLAGLGGEGIHVEAAPYSSDEAVRREYWAADVLAVWSRRGESFGNVLLEALGCRLPVVYKAVTTRDNTPHEFRGISGFSYVRGRREWVRAATQAQGQKVDSAQLRPYARRTLTEQLATVVNGYDGNGDRLFELLSTAFARPIIPNFPNVAAAALLHNPIMALVKSVRHRLRALRGRAESRSGA